MKKDELLSVIYSYYPRGITRDDDGRYWKSREWQARSALSYDFFIGNIQRWEDFITGLKDYLNNGERPLADYSSFCHHIEFTRFKGTTLKNVAVIDIFISYVAPFWSYELQDHERKFHHTVPMDFVAEKELIDNIGILIEQYFDGYRLLPADWGKTAIPDIETPTKGMPDVTISDALFRG